jgi:hypothetical protein
MYLGKETGIESYNLEHVRKDANLTCGFQWKSRFVTAFNQEHLGGHSCCRYGVFKHSIRKKLIS